MLRRVLFLSLIVLISCDGKDEDVAPCEDMFIVKELNTGGKLYFLYNDFDKLEVVFDTAWFGDYHRRIEFLYSANQVLTEVKTYVKGKLTQTKIIHFDSRKRISAITRRYDSLSIDSSAVTYTGDKVSHIDTYRNKERQIFSLEFSYPSENTVITKEYGYINVSEGDPPTLLQSEYTFDQETRPYPREFYFYEDGNLFLPEHNIKSSKITYEPFDPVSIDYTYTYNSAGYPTKEDYSKSQYRYQCSAPRVP